jgi:hypothetical protein
MSDQKRENSTIRKDILETLDRVFPGNVIETWEGMEESYLDDIYDELKAKLSAIETAYISYERDWAGDEDGIYGHSPSWGYDDDDLDDFDESQVENFSASYHLFFFDLKDSRFNYECENETVDDDNNKVKVEGGGTIGCSVGICLLAPFAVIVPDYIETYVDGSRTLPDILPSSFDISSMEPIDMEEHIRQWMGEEAVQAVKELSDRIASVLKAFGISVLPADEAEKPVLWLQPGEGVLINPFPGKPVKLRDAFFFRYI